MQLTLKDGRTVDVRPIQANDDVFEFAKFVNATIDEDLYLNIDEKQSPETEAKWLEGVLEWIDRGEIIHWVAWAGKECVAFVEARRGIFRQRDLASFGIVIARQYRGVGLGKQLMLALIKDVREKWSPRKIFIDYFDGNDDGRRLYESVGFREVARLPKWVMYRGKEVDNVFMVLG